MCPFKGVLIVLFMAFFRRKIAIEDTIVEKGSVKFCNVVGLTNAKQALKEAIIMPLQYPHLFTGNILSKGNIFNDEEHYVESDIPKTEVIIFLISDVLVNSYQIPTDSCNDVIFFLQG